MYNFVLQMIMMLSLGTVVYLAARALPRVGERVVPGSPAQYMDKLVKKIPIEKLDAFLNATLEKILRKSKIFILKVDNRVTFYLNKFKKNGNGKEAVKPDLFENNNSETQNKE
ncbi:MAG TPA: hypothetical protein VJH70_03390 [Candidatus Paceibacterota bacterium]